MKSKALRVMTIAFVCVACLAGCSRSEGVARSTAPITNNPNAPEANEARRFGIMFGTIDVRRVSNGDTVIVSGEGGRSDDKLIDED